MTSAINQVSSANNASGINAQTASANSSTSEIVSSFKDIFSTMMLGGGMSSGAQMSSGMGDLFTPLLMLILLDKLVESGMEIETGAKTQSGTLISNGVARNEPSGRPVGGILTQDFHPGHNGLDFGIPVGTQVKSTMDGNVVYAGWNNQGYGNLVIVEHGDYKTYYAHLSSIPVSVGDSVSAGTTIGLSGNTGNSTGPHLHYEIRRNNVPIDPTAATLGA